MSYCGLVDVRINASDKGLPVPRIHHFFQQLLPWNLAWTQTIQTWLIIKFRCRLNTKNRVSLKFQNCSFYKVGTSILRYKKYTALLSYLYCLKCWTKGMKIKTLIGLLTWLCLTFSMSVCRFKPNGQQLTAVRNVQIWKHVHKDNWLYFF